MKLIDAFLPLFAYVVELQQQPLRLQNSDYTSVRTDIERMLVESSQHAIDYGYSDDQYEYARFGMVVYLDELMLSFDWSGKKEWIREMLQKVYYDVANGGTEFYERLERLNPVNPAEKDIREVYFYALCLGFQGKLFRSLDQSVRQQVTKSSHAMLTDTRRLEDELLFPQAYGKEIESRQISRTVNLNILIYALPVVIIWGMFYFLKTEVLELSQNLLGIF